LHHLRLRLQPEKPNCGSGKKNKSAPFSSATLLEQLICSLSRQDGSLEATGKIYKATFSQKPSREFPPSAHSTKTAFSPSHVKTGRKNFPTMGGGP
jgi:hypothetical protein